MNRRDPLTADMFEVPVPRTPLPGALDFGKQLRALISDCIKASPLDRFAIAACMSKLTDQEITKHQLDSWTAESREAWRFPLEYLPALEVALETHAITAWLVGLRGGKLLIGREALEAELGKIERQKHDLAGQAKQIKAMIRRRA